jgi:hypothetical protein
MTTYRGEGGSVRFNKVAPASGIAQVRSWSMNVEKTEVETTDLGSGYRKYMGSLVGASGTAEIFYDAGATSSTKDFLDAVNDPEDDADSIFELYTTDDRKITFNGMITGMDISATPGEAIMGSCSFRCNGTITTSGLYTA